MTVPRKTAQGKAKQAENKAVQKKEKDLFKATLKDKKELAAEGGNEEDSDWESVEEDFPHVKLEELLENLTINDTKNNPEVEEEETKDQD